MLTFLFSYFVITVISSNVLTAEKSSKRDPNNILRAENIWNQSNELELDLIRSLPKHRLWPPTAPSQTKLDITWSLTARATVDGCFCAALNESLPGSCDESQIASGCKNKISESYAWGMTRTRDSLYWGTIANIVCLTSNIYYVTSNTGCLGDGKDVQMPSIYKYNEISDQTISLQDQLTGVHLDRLNQTVGLRAAGNKNGVVILGGLGRSLESVYMFAFSSSSGKFLDSVELQGYNDMRKFTQKSAYAMYVGISRVDGTGAIMRFIGSLTDPLLFELVGEVIGNPAEVSFYGDQLLVGTWSNAANLSDTSDTSPCKLLMSPVPADQLPAIEAGVVATAVEWVKVWGIEDYEPDPLLKYTYGTSVSVQVGQWLYWGTVQLPFSGYEAFISAYGEPNGTKALTEYLVFTHRACILYRGRYLNTSSPEIELLYGEPFLPVFNPNTSHWKFVPNHAPNIFPLLGRSGFGNPYNLYLWSMASYKNTHLLIGTDDTYNYSFALSAPPNRFGFMSPVMGADLFIMPLPPATEESQIARPATWITLDGMGNPFNYGFRNLVPKEYGDVSMEDASIDDAELDIFIGTANGYNLNPNGGWEVFELHMPR